MQVELQVKGMTCSNCALTVEKYLKKEGMEAVMVDFSNDEVIFDTVDEKKIPRLIKGINKLGYTAVANPPAEGEKTGLSKVEKYFYISLPFTFLLLLHMFVPWHVLHNPWLQLILATPVFAIGLWHFGRSGWHSLKGGIPNMDVLIILGAMAAYGYSLFGTLTEAGPDFLFYETAASIITLVLLGNVIEHRAVAKTTSAVKALMQLQKGIALRIIESPDGEIMERIPADAIQKGYLIQINQGDRIPVDGQVIWGEGTVDESMITGESEAIFKQKDDQIIGGTLLQSGNIRFEATAVGKQTVLAQIIDMVKRAQAEKPEIQLLADRISAVFVPVVVSIALLTFLLSYFVFDLSLQAAIIHSVAVLVISCPCAMGLATPTAVVVGIGRASKKGILIKGGRTLEAFSKLKYVVFDKTGTLTTGNFQVESLNCAEADKADVEAVIAGLESRSSHPIAASLQKAFGSTKTIDWAEIEEIEGHGITGRDLQGNDYRLGSYRWAKELTTDDQHQLYLLKNGSLWATVDLRDEIREGAKTALDALKARGLTPVMLSGDRLAKCETVAQQLGIEQVYAEKLPAEKLQIIDQLNKAGGAAMVGDGINDAPALAQARVGISLSQATQAAIQSADIVLLHGRLSGLKDLLAIGKHTVLTIRQNLFWAFAYNVVAIPLAAFGFLSPILGAAAMAFSDVVVVGNSLRLRGKRIE
jgi:Cu+-exporting ATPase